MNVKLKLFSGKASSDVAQLRIHCLSGLKSSDQQAAENLHFAFNPRCLEQKFPLQGITQYSTGATCNYYVSPRSESRQHMFEISLEVGTEALIKGRTDLVLDLRRVPGVQFCL